MNDETLTILVGGDTVPIGPGVAMFEAGDAGALVGERLLGMFRAADFAVLNLEAPLADAATPIEKHGPNLAAPTSAARGLAAVNPHAFVLANNHVMDQGADGLASTLRALEGAGLRAFGAGVGLAAAREPLVFEKNGVRVGFLACAEHEFSIAGEGVPGAAPFDPLETPDAVAALKEHCDRVVVLYHGGKEHYRYPSPGLRRVCRKLAEKGADLVACQHSHCVGCAERWAGSTIVYGQGNFLFDGSDDEFWSTGLLLRLSVSKSQFSVEYVPLRKEGTGVRAAEGADAEAILAGFEGRSGQIARPGFVEGEYARFARGCLSSYVRAFAPGTHGLAFRALDKLSGHRMSAALARRADRLAMRNYLECEAHRELFLAGLACMHEGGAGRGCRR